MWRRIRPPQLLVGVLVLLAVLAMTRFFAVQGWLTPVRVVSGSMADRLWGDHFLVTCADCEFIFSFGVDSPPVNERAVCPNCGYAKNIPRREWRRRGDKVMIDRAAYWLESPPRWELVAFRDPRLAARLVVKRVVGLPGERLAIRQGDLFVNGERLRKRLADWRRVRLLVHDQQFRPAEKRHLLERWREEDSEPQWIWDDGRFQFEPRTLSRSLDTKADTKSETEAEAKPRVEAETAAEPEWLKYHHWRCFANPFPRGSEAPVADNYGYNQGESRELRPVADLQVQFHLNVSQAPWLALRIHDGREWFRVELAWDTRTIEVTRAGVAWHEISMPEKGKQIWSEVEFGLLDRQLVLALDGVEVLRLPYESSERPFDLLATPLAIGGLMKGLELKGLRVWRDVHYLDPWCVGQPWETPIAGRDGEYLVLGDNPPLSDDSRRWDAPWLPASQLVGRVLPLPR